MATQRQEEWFNGAVGRPMNPDNVYGRQCVDAADDNAIWLFGDWVSTLGYGNANTLFDGASNAYFDKVRNNQADPNQLPPRGAYLCYGGWNGNDEGHILLVEGADSNGYTGIEQDGFSVQYDSAGRVINEGKPAYRVTRSWNWHAPSIIGWLIPKENMMIGYAAAPVPLLPYQRRLADVVNVRVSADTSQPYLEQYQKGDVLDIGGWKHGQVVDGNDIWLKGLYRDVWMTLTAFEDQDLHDIQDLNPKEVPAELANNQRKVADDGLNVRQAPHRNASIIRVLAPNTVITVNGYVLGEEVEGNNIWFDIDGGLVWSGGTNSKNTVGLKNITPESPTVPPVVTPTPTPVPTPLTFEKELACVTEVITVNPTNYEVGNFPADPQGVVLHDLGTDGRDTVESSINQFKAANTTAPHFLVSGRRIIQCGKLTWRMYHAGPQGNDKYGIEIDPDVDTNPETRASVEILIAELEAHTAHSLSRHLHSEFMATLCGDDVKKAGLLEAPTPIPTPTPVPIDPVTPTPEPQKPGIPIAEVKKVLVNVGVTFIQAFVAVWALTGYKLDKGALGGAIGAGLSVVWNTIIKPYLISKGIIKKQ